MQYYYHVFLIQFIVWNVKYYYNYHHGGIILSSSLIYVHGWMFRSSYYQCRYKRSKMNFHKKWLIENSHNRCSMNHIGNSKLTVNDYDPTMTTSSQQNHEQLYNHTYSNSFITPRRHALEVILGSSVTSVLLQERLLYSANAVTTTTSKSQLTSTDSENLEQRLQSNIIQQPNIGTTTTTANGNDMTIYPYYMYGTWNVTQTLISVQAPLGLQYMGGPNGNIKIAQQSMKETQQQMNQPISFQLRYIKCKLKRNHQSKTNNSNNNNNDDTNDYVIVEDRLFNTRQRFNAYAKQNVVSNVVYANTKSSNNEIMNQLYECNCYDNNNNDTTTTTATTGTTNTTMDVPLTTTITYFKGPAVQKMFVLAHHNSNTVPTTSTCTSSISSKSLSSISKWTGYEYQRTIFALTNRNTVPPITTDTELIIQYQIPNYDTTTTTNGDNDDCNNSILSNHHHLIGTLRIINYLTPNDQYYFNVHNRGITIQDYKLDMYRCIL